VSTLKLKSVVLFAAVLFVTLFALKAENFIVEPKLNHSDQDGFSGSSFFNVNIEDKMAIDYLESAFSVPADSFSIMPRGFADTFPFLENPYKISPFFSGVQQKSFWQIVSSTGFDYYYSNKPGNFVSGSAGKRFEHPGTVTSFQKGNLLLFDILGFHWDFRQSNYFQKTNWEGFDLDVHRVYAKLKLWKLSLTGGKDNIHLGPGEYGLLFSSNVEPFWMIKFQNEETIKLWGDWNFVFMKGWFFEEREDASNTEVFGIRMTYRPKGLFSFFELGMSRTGMFGGEGRHNYKFYEYPYLIIGREENVPKGKWDSDGFGAIDWTFNIPLYKLIPAVKVFKFYFQEAGTDISAVWQVEDDKIVFPYLLFRFYERGYITGIFMATEKDIFRLEYSKTAKTFYRHHNYKIEGFQYKGMSPGHPFGTNHQAIRFNHRHWFNNSFSFKWELGFYQLPAEKNKDHSKKFSAFFPLFTLGDGIVRRGYGTLWADLVIKGHLLRGYLSVDGGAKSDLNPSPTTLKISDESSVDAVFGLSAILKF
jgi:hypothetical protein